MTICTLQRLDNADDTMISTLKTRCLLISDILMKHLAADRRRGTKLASLGALKAPMFGEKEPLPPTSQSPSILAMTVLQLCLLWTSGSPSVRGVSP